MRIRIYFRFLCLIDAYQNLSGRISSQFSKNCFNWFLAHWQELQIILRFDILSAPPCFPSTGWTCSIVTEQGSFPGAEALVIVVSSHCGHSLPTCESRKARTFGFWENLRDEFWVLFDFIRIILTVQRLRLFAGIIDTGGLRPQWATLRYSGGSWINWNKDPLNIPPIQTNQGVPSVRTLVSPEAQGFRSTRV